MDVTEYVSQSDWLKPTELQHTGSFAVILNEGELYKGKYGERFRILVEFKQEQRYLTVTKTSLKELAKEYGTETKNWVGKVVLLTPVNVIVDGDMKQMVYCKPHRGPTPGLP